MSAEARGMFLGALLRHFLANLGVKCMRRTDGGYAYEVQDGWRKNNSV